MSLLYAELGRPRGVTRLKRALVNYTFGPQSLKNIFFKMLLPITFANNTSDIL